MRGRERPARTFLLVGEIKEMYNGSEGEFLRVGYYSEAVMQEIDFIVRAKSIRTGEYEYHALKYQFAYPLTNGYYTTINYTDAFIDIEFARFKWSFTDPYGVRWCRDYDGKLTKLSD